MNARFDLGAFEFQEPSDLNLIVDTLVDESDDSFVPGDLSLREAVELANSFPSTDTIRFDLALLTSGPAVIELSMGELVITDDVSIEGFGMGLLIVDASGNDPTPAVNNGDGSRVFRIDDGVSGSQISVTISGLTITGGDVADGGGGIRSVENLTVAATTVRNNATTSGQVDPDTPGGGGIFSGAGNLTVVGSNIAENMSFGGSSNLGGGIHSSGGNLSVTGSTISSNSSRVGGGISVFHLGEAGSTFLSTVTVEGSTISGNSALGGSGIFCINAQLAVVESTISGNMATGGTPFPGGSQASGGGIHTRGNGHTTVTDSTVRDNTSAFEGGGITSSNALTVIGSTITGNTAEMRGGGIYAFTNVTLRDSIVSDNIARFGGGLIKLSGYGQIAIEDSTITDNTANSRGGGIFNDRGPLTVTGSTISGNTAETESGGGISQGSGALSIAQSEIHNNEAGTDGGGVAVSGGQSEITDTEVHHNLAGGNGGGIWQRNGPIVVNSTTVNNNSAEQHGGGLFLWDTSIAAISGSTIRENSAMDGGGVFHNSDSGPPNVPLTLTVALSTVQNNSAALGGGGIAQQRGKLVVDRTMINGNKAVTGGGIANEGGRLIVSESTISANIAESSGGGIANDSGHLTLAASTLSGNSATVGGGLSHYSNLFAPGAVEVTYSTLSGNSAMLGGGAFLFPSSVETPAIRHSTLADNSASNAGGGLFVVGSDLDLNQTLIATNEAPFGPDLTGFLGAGLNAHFSLIGNGSNSGLAEAAIGAPDANGNLVGGLLNGIIDPKLDSLAENGGMTPTHALLPNSPALDAGDPAAMAGLAGVPMYDQRGAPFARVFDGAPGGGKRIDIGAFERPPSSPAAFGDYDRNGAVDAADYVVWRKSLGTAVTPYEGADGDGSGMIDDSDRAVWRAHFNLVPGPLAPVDKSPDMPVSPDVMQAAALLEDVAAQLPRTRTSLIDASTPGAKARWLGRHAEISARCEVGGLARRRDPVLRSNSTSKQHRFCRHSRDRNRPK